MCIFLCKVAYWVINSRLLNIKLYYIEIKVCKESRMEI